MPDPARGVRRRRTLEEARLKVDISTRLTRIRKIEDTLDEARGPEGAELSSNAIGALKLDADIQFRLLAKVLPDLKQVDMTLFQEDATFEEVLHELRELVRSNPSLAPLASGIEAISADDADAQSVPH